MKAAVYYENGAPSVFRYEEVPDPVAGAGEMLIKVEVVSIEGGDTLNRLGGPLTTIPHVVGYQCAGTVLSVGDDVTGFAVGERVVSLAFHGSHAQLRVTHPLTTWTIPDGLAIELAACVPVAYGTAHDGLFEFGRLVEGETALIHAGASGTGIAAIQMAKRAGARVIATASSDERLERLTELGLDDGINYREQDFVAAVRALTNNKGADVILDSVGGENLQKSLSALAYRGRCVTFGNAGRGEAIEAGHLDAGHLEPESDRLLPRTGTVRRVAGARHDRERFSTTSPQETCASRSIADSRSPTPKRRTRSSRVVRPSAAWDG